MIIWLASYPKSGNTWVRLFLSSYFLEKNKKFELNTIDNIKGFPNPKILQSLNVNTNNFIDIAENWIPMQEYLNLQNNKFILLKTHNALCTVNNNKFTNKENTSGVIHIIRDPRDVILSYADYLGHKDYNKTLKIILSNHGEYQDMGDYKYKKSIFGSWADHYKSWRDFKDVQRLLIKYEDLILKPNNTFEKIIIFLNKINGTSIDKNKIKSSVELTKFENLRIMEEKGDFFEKGKGKFFFREGVVGNWKKFLDKSISSEIEEKFKEEMRELNYI